MLVYELIWSVILQEISSLRWASRSEDRQVPFRVCWSPLGPPGFSWSHMVHFVSLWSEQQQQVLLTLSMVIRTKQIIGLKLGSCFLLLPVH